jgi:hypothetical protein
MSAKRKERVSFVVVKGRDEVRTVREERSRGTEHVTEETLTGDGGRGILGVGVGGEVVRGVAVTEETLSLSLGREERGKGKRGKGKRKSRNVQDVVDADENTHKSDHRPDPVNKLVLREGEDEETVGGKGGMEENDENEENRESQSRCTSWEEGRVTHPAGMSQAKYIAPQSLYSGMGIPPFASRLRS